MPITTTKSAYWKGFRDGAPFVIIVAPFAALFGVLAIEAGLNILETMAFSVAVFAGAAQFTALQLMEEQAPTIIVLLSALAVNLRLVMYSAALTPYFGNATLKQRLLIAYFTVDQSYALSFGQFEAAPSMSLQQRFAYFAGTLSLIVPTWYVSSYLGALMSAQIPPALVPDFALPICFLAMVGPMLRTGAHIMAAGVAILAGLLFAGVPYSLGLIIASALGMMAGARCEAWMVKRGSWA